MAKKRALTQARRAGPVEGWGEEGYAQRLAHALDVSAEEPRILTHGFHPYAGRMHPITARRVIEALRLTADDLLYDPFCGSGTVLVEGLRAGVRTTGADISPLACLIARTKTWNGPRRELTARARAIADAVLTEGKDARRSGYEEVPHRRLYKHAQPIVNGAFLPHVRRELEALLAAIDREKKELGDPLRAVLSSIVVKVSGKEKQLPRGMAARLLASRAEELADGLDALWREVPKGTELPAILNTDAFYVETRGRIVDAVLTSPPYPGTYDYATQHSLPLAFLGMLTQDLHKRELGARRRFAENLDEAVYMWERTFRQTFQNIVTSVRRGSKVVILMGDSVAGTPKRAKAMFVEEALELVAPEVGLGLIAGASVDRDKLGSLETRAFGKRPKREHLIMYSVM